MINFESKEIEIKIKLNPYNPRIGNTDKMEFGIKSCHKKQYLQQ